MRRLTVLLGVVTAVAVAGTLTYRDATAVRDALVTARTTLSAAETAVADEDLPLADQRLAEAAAAAAVVPGRLDGPVWAVLGVVPRVGDTPEVARAAAELVVAGAELGLAATDTAADVLSGDAFGEILSGGSIDLEGLAAFGVALEELPTAPVRAARDRLAATDPANVLAALRADRTTALEQTTELLDLVARAGAALDAMGEFLGGEGRRTYLVAAQNPSELRGTGGLIGFMMELTLDDGAITLREGFSFDADEQLDQRTQLESTRDLPPPVTRDPAFAERYDHVAGGQFFGSVNLDPDLPTVAPVLLALYEQETGRDLDGVVLLDPVAVGAIVAATERPLQLPDQLDTAGLPHRLPGSSIGAVIMVDGYDAFGGGGPGKKALDRAIIAAALERLVAESWDGGLMARALRTQTAQRHLQLYSATPATQQALELIDVAGRMARAEDRDVLAVTGANAAPNKADVHVAHRITGRIELTDITGTGRDLVRRDATVEVAVDNPLRPGDHDTYITGSSDSVRFGSGTPERRQDALARTWLSIWTPPLSRLQSPTDGVGGRALRVDSIHDHRVVDLFLETPSASTTSFSASYSGEVPLRFDGSAWVYELELWRQAKAIPDGWDLTITGPGGWRVVGATVTGGGTPTGMGVGGDGQRIRADVVDGRARIVGAVTQDATVLVRLTPP